MCKRIIVASNTFKHLMRGKSKSHMTPIRLQMHTKTSVFVGTWNSIFLQPQILACVCSESKESCMHGRIWRYSRINVSVWMCMMIPRHSTSINSLRIFSNQHRVNNTHTVQAQVHKYSPINIWFNVPQQVSLRWAAFCSHQQASGLILVEYLIFTEEKKLGHSPSHY